jgi:hypothetical protein
MPRTTLPLLVAASQFTRRGECRGALTVLPLGQHGDPHRGGQALPWVQAPEPLPGWLACFSASSGGVSSAVTWSCLELFTYLLHEIRQEVMEKFGFCPKTTDRSMPRLRCDKLHDICG